MANRSIEVLLSLNASKFKQEAAAAAQALGGVADAGDKSASKLSGGFDRAERNIADAREATQTLGVGMAAVGATMLGVTAAVAKTGGQYNILQQSSRAALATLLGGTKAANAQMDRLDTFAKTSPFAKQTFIRAQQQMLAFGVETKRVIPYLDAVQQSVAAMGGSDTDIAQIVDVLAKVKSQGKITARELMQLGVHGIDAATLIGNAMGKTGNQIREEITAGTLGADQALDALTQGMMTRFGGAADGVKNTMVGAVDRVKAAFRDLSSSMMDPFIGKEGGGHLVAWTNSFADAIRFAGRQVDVLPDAAKMGIMAVGGLGGAAMTAAGAFLALAPRIVDTHTALWELATNPAGGAMGKMASGLLSLGGFAAPAAIAVGALTAGFAVYSSKAQDAMARTAGYSSAIEGLGGSAEDLDTALAKVAVNSVVTGENMDWGWIQKANTGFSSFNDLLSHSGVSLTQWGEAVTRGGSSVDALEAQLTRAFHAGQLTGGQYDELRSKLHQQANAAQEARDAAADLAAGEAEVEAAMGGAAGAAEAAAESIETYKAALQGLLDLQDRMVNSFLAGRQALREWTSATEEFDSAVEMSEETLDAYADTARKSVNTMIEAVDANGDRIYSEEQLVGMMQQSRDAVIASAEAMGMSRGEAEHLANSLGLIPEEVPIKMSAQDDASAEIEKILSEFDGLPKETISKITVRDDASEVAAAVKVALENGVPPEMITRIIAEDEATNVMLPVAQRLEAMPTEYLALLQASDETAPPTQSAKSTMQSLRDVSRRLSATNETARPKAAAQAAIDSLRGKTVSLNAADNASGVVGRVQSIINSLTGKTVHVTTVHSTVGSQAKAKGGAVFGPGSGTSDDIPVWMSNSEHVMTAAEVDRFGGHGNVYALRSMMRSRPEDLRRALGLAGGGPASTVGRPVRLPAPVVLPASGGGPAQVTVFVENPFTGAEVEARVARTVVRYL